MKPILFSTDMVRAILENRKTQTRRVIKTSVSSMLDLDVDGRGIGFYDQAEGRVFPATNYAPYQIGDILWVRETWMPCATIDSMLGGDSFYTYKADWSDISLEMCKAGVMGKDAKWRPSIFMPREAARIFLRVTDVRAERVQDISEADAKAEGVARLFDNLTAEGYEVWAKRVGHNVPQNENSYNNYLWHGHFGQYGMGNKQSDSWEYQRSGYDSARDSFSSLWELINAKRGYGWDVNPWVWVYEFERVSKEEL